MQTAIVSTHYISMVFIPFDLEEYSSLTLKIFLFLKSPMSPSIIFHLSLILSGSLLLLSVVPSLFESIIIKEGTQLVLGQMSKH